MTTQVWTTEEQSYGLEMLDDGRQQVISGDIKLDDYRLDFQRKYNRPTTLTDDQLLHVVMSADDDYEMEWYLPRMLDAERLANLTAQRTVTGLISVTETAEGYEIGASLSDPSDVSRYFRLVFNNSQQDGSQWEYSDDVILDIIRGNARIEQEDDETYNERILDLMQDFTPEKARVLPDLSVQDRVNVGSAHIKEQALKAAEIINQNSEMIGILRGLDTAVKTAYMGSVTIHLQLMKMINDGFDFFGYVAEPGTEKVDVRPGTNELWDIYEEYVPTTGGTRVKKTFSQLNVICDQLLPIREAVASSAEFQKEISAEKLVALNRANKAATDKTRTSLRSAFKQACLLVYRRKDMDGLLKLNHSFFLDAEAKSTKVTPRPIRVWEPETGNASAVTVTQFLSYQPRKLAPTATLADLVASIPGREPRKPEADYPMPKKMEQLELMTNVFTSALMDPDLFSEALKASLKSPTSEFVTACRTLFYRLDTLLAPLPQSQDDKVLSGAAKTR